MDNIYQSVAPGTLVGFTLPITNKTIKGWSDYWELLIFDPGNGNFLGKFIITVGNNAFVCTALSTVLIDFIMNKFYSIQFTVPNYVSHIKVISNYHTLVKSS